MCFVLQVNVSSLDSVQILGHKEYFSGETRHELVMLRRAECQPLAQVRHQFPHSLPSKQGDSSSSFPPYVAWRYNLYILPALRKAWT